MISSNRFKCENGLTLVEILASLVILGIVFVGFMTVFPQMTHFNEKTGTKLETMNLAKIELEKILKESPSDEYLLEIKSNNKNAYWIKEYTTDKYSVKAEFSTTPILWPENNNEHERQVYLYEIKVKVLEGNKTKSETFGYYQVNSSQ